MASAPPDDTVGVASGFEYPVRAGADDRQVLEAELLDLGAERTDVGVCLAQLRQTELELPAASLETEFDPLEIPGRFGVGVRGAAGLDVGHAFSETVVTRSGSAGCLSDSGAIR